MMGSSFEVDLHLFMRNLSQVVHRAEKASKKGGFKRSGYDAADGNSVAFCNGDQLYTMDGDHMVSVPDAYCKEIFQEILRQALKARGRHKGVDLANLDQLGRILLYSTCIPNTETGPSADGACYIEERQMPPVSTWFYLKDGYQQFGPDRVLTLFCWIPREMEAAIQHNIDFETMKQYNWLDEYAPAFFRRIRQGY